MQTDRQLIEFCQAPQSFHASMQAFVFALAHLFSREELRNIERAMRCNRALVAFIRIGGNQVRIVGVVCFDATQIPVAAPGGRVSGQTTTVKTVFGLVVDPEFRVGLADYLVGTALILAALTGKGFGPVLAMVPREYERKALKHFRVHEAESAFVAQTPKARQFANWALQQSQRIGQEMPLIGICDHEDLAAAAGWFARTRFMIALPGGADLVFLDRSAGRNFLVQAALAIGLDRPGWRHQVGLGSPPRFG
jgi:hypothetical protein